VGIQVAFVGGNDACAFLPPMLKGVQAEISQCSGFRVAVHAEQAAFLTEIVAASVASPDGRPDPWTSGARAGVIGIRIRHGSEILLAS
jgi:hypothetical protein